MGKRSKSSNLKSIKLEFKDRCPELSMILHMWQLFFFVVPNITFLKSSLWSHQLFYWLHSRFPIFLLLTEIPDKENVSLTLLHWVFIPKPNGLTTFLSATHFLTRGCEPSDPWYFSAVAATKVTDDCLVDNDLYPWCSALSLLTYLGWPPLNQWLLFTTHVLIILKSILKA